MKKIVLLGDSIRQMGYGLKVPEFLGEGYEVWQPADNCRFAQYTLRGMWDWKEQLAGADVIHWNNGLWDICELFGDGPFTDIGVYVDTMTRIARILLGYCPKVIFATTTPVTSVHPHNKNERIHAYNEAIVPELTAMGIAINDLYSLVYPNIDTFIRKDDNIHLTEPGIDACAAQVTDFIRRAAE